MTIARFQPAIPVYRPHPLVNDLESGGRYSARSVSVALARGAVLLTAPASVSELSALNRRLSGREFRGHARGVRRPV